MRIENRTRTTVLGSRVTLAASWFSRLRGFLGRPEPLPGEGILLTPCNSIHTFGIQFDLDVLFLDEQGKVLKLIRGLRPWRFTRRVRQAEYVLEVPPGVIHQSGTHVGDLLTWWDPAPLPISDRIQDRRTRHSQPFASARRHP
jgi:hypothetical protein